ncbi:MAG: hypothetical protein HW388_66 [Dehalococcoidia bacterium]|nr:hypothetical protein [Dehalococcoidia bacterium]
MKNLFQERGRLLISIGGVAAALVLVLLLEGVFVGVSQDLVTYPERAGADVWVMQEGVSNMHMASSVLPSSLRGGVEAVPGVRDATPILYVSSPVEAGERRWFSYIVGVRPDAAAGGPWAMARGTAIPGPGEAVIPDVLARQGGVDLGNTVTVLGRQFRVVGLSMDTFSMVNSITFLAYDELEQLLEAPGAASYFLVRAEAEAAPDALATRIQQAVPGVHVMTREAFVASDLDMSRQMGVDLIQIMTWIGSVVGALVVGLTMYTATVRRAREYGIAKALGAKNRHLLAVVALQALVVVLLGLGTAVAVAYLARALIPALAPEIALDYPVGSLLRVSVVAVGIAALAALLPAYRIARVEPGVVFKE